LVGAELEQGAAFGLKHGFDKLHGPVYGVLIFAHLLGGAVYMRIIVEIGNETD
jgi:uncharacterized protein YaaW (UPF0174 family)